MIRLITRKEVSKGLGKWSPCYMFGIQERKFKCNMWLKIFDEVGGIGFIPLENNNPVGQMIFLPKKYARRVGLSTCRTNKNIEKTMVISCLYVFGEYQNRGIASAMIKELISFCNKNGYKRIEAGGSKPFKKLGFIVDKTSIGYEFDSKTKMCFYDIKC